MLKLVKDTKLEKAEVGLIKITRNEGKHRCFMCGRWTKSNYTITIKSDESITVCDSCFKNIYNTLLTNSLTKEIFPNLYREHKELKRIFIENSRK
jgi:transcription elongation factor Elf1